MPQPISLTGSAEVSDAKRVALDSEPSLVARARRDPDAFAALYRLHHPAIAGYIGRRIGDPEVTQDLVAETFLTALEKLPGYRERGAPFRAWL